MARITMMAAAFVVMLGACSRSAETQESGGAEADTRGTESVVVEEQRPVMTDEEMIELLEQIDAGNIEDIDFEQYLGVRLPSHVLQRWTQEKRQSQNESYGSGGTLVPRPAGDRGALHRAYLPSRVAFFYSTAEAANFLFSDWLIVEKENTLVTIEELFSVSDTSSFTGERVEYSFGLEHWDFETDPLVYDQWFHPDAIIRIDPDAGTLELIEEVPADQYIMIEGV